MWKWKEITFPWCSRNARKKLTILSHASCVNTKHLTFLSKFRWGLPGDSGLGLISGQGTKSPCMLCGQGQKKKKKKKMTILYLPGW